MLIHPWDAALDGAEWQEWVASTDRFGVLAVNNLDPTAAPVIVPTHFTVAGDELLIHLARPNPVWPHLETAGEVRLALIGDYAYIPTHWRAKAGGPDEDGVPTRYYSAVQFVCRPSVVDDADGKAAILTAQLADFQPEGGHATVAVGEAPYGRMLPGIRGVRLSCCASRPSSSTTITTPSSTANASSATSSSATTGSTPTPRRSNGDGSRRSGNGRRSATESLTGGQRRSRPRDDHSRVPCRKDHPMGTVIDPAVSVPMALAGRVITMDAQATVFERGVLYARDGAITAVLDEHAPAPDGFADVPVVRTASTICPGLIELHNHLPYDVLPLWAVPKLFTDR